MTRNVSHSEISTIGCHRHWNISYYRGLSPREQSSTGAAPTGTLLHLFAEQYYRGLDPFTTLDEQYVTEIQLVESGEVTGSVEETTKKFDLVRTMGSGYLEWLAETGADADLEVVAVEKIIKDVPSPLPERYTLQGKIDLVVRQKSTGALGFMDHKTVGSFAGAIKMLSLNTQAKMYALLFRAVTGESPRFITWNMFLKSKRTVRAKPPFYDRYSLHVNDAELDRYWDRIYGILTDMARIEDALDAGADPMVVCYPNPTTECPWKCELFAICGMFDDPHSDVEHILADRWVSRDPYERYHEKVSETLV